MSTLTDAQIEKIATEIQAQFSADSVDEARDYDLMLCRAAIAVDRALAAHPELQADGVLQRFLNAAAGEGLVLDGVDAADLYVGFFPDAYARAISGITSDAAAATTGGQS